jgi:dCTP deaminase
VILTGDEIYRQVQRGSIHIDPFERSHITSNSYDVTVTSPILTYVSGVLDPARENEVQEHDLPLEGLVLSPKKIYLVGTKETIGSSEFVPIVKGRSSAARLGIFAHVTADLVDLGYIGKLTLQVHVVQPVLLYPDSSIAQVTFWAVRGAVSPYSGKYMGAIGPMPSRSWVGWERDQEAFRRLDDNWVEASNADE